MSTPTHTMTQQCDYCNTTHRGESRHSLDDARQDLWHQIARCRRIVTGMTTTHYPAVVNYNDNFIDQNGELI